MWSTNPQETSGQRRSNITCHSCRRRKVKCDRELPFCRVCVETEQTCEYPARPMKPGPKIGSLQRPRTRRPKDLSQQKAATREAQRARDQSFSPAEEDVEMVDRGLWDDENDTGPAPSSRQGPSPSSSSLSASRRKSVASVSWQEDERRPSCRRSSQLNINDLSFILHPSHETSSPGQDASATSAIAVESPESERRELYQEACGIIGLTPSIMDKIIPIYFENMVAINLFHKPSFQDTLKAIASRLQLSALLAAIAGYAVQFVSTADHPDLERELQTRQVPGQCLSSTLVSLASRCTEQALDECSDEPPPLCLLQALIVTTHCELTRGVRGKAWRSLGMCIRVAYELNFHLLDAIIPGRPTGASPPAAGHDERWCVDEEKRRAWWAIWEMDVFASTIRRTPTAIDWTQMEVLLPMPDEDWYNNKPVESCFFERDPGQRWRSLHEIESRSAKAWFIVINSLMKDAQVISCPRGVPPVAAATARAGGGGSQDTPRHTVQYPLDDPEESRQKLETLANSVNCLVRTLPAHLRFRQQFLSFASAAAGQTESPRQLHCSIYNIYVMTQLTRLMIYRYDVFGSQMASQLTAPSGPEKRKMASSSSFQEQETPALKQYFEAADNILAIINRSSENHIQYINPFLSSTIWLAAAVQLVRKQFGGGGSSSPTQTALVKTRFDVLYLTYKQCVSFWGTQTAMQQNLEIIEAQLEGINPVPAAAAAAPTASTAWARIPQKRRWIPNTPDTMSGAKGQGGKTETRTKTTTEIPALSEGMMAATCTVNGTSTGLPDTPPPSDVGGDQFTLDLGNGMSQPAPSNSVVTTNIQGTEYVDTPSQQLPQTDPRFLERVQSLVSNTDSLDFLNMPDNLNHDVAMYAPMDAWKDFQLPSDICDLLSGVSTY